MPKQTKERKDYCRARLLELLQPGDMVHSTVTHVARSGMSRTIDFYIFREEGDARNPRRIWLTPFIGDLLETSWGDGGIKVSGCGMDMRFHIVYNLGATLWPTGFGCIGEKCASNDHSNGDRDRTPHGDTVLHRDGKPVTRPHQHWHTDGGYALRSER